MGTSERRLEMMKYLCRKRHATMSELSREFGVSVRTVQRDIFELGFTMPLEVRAGRYDGGVYVIGGYTIDRMYMNEAELNVLGKLASLVEENIISVLNDEERSTLHRLIENYTKPHKRIT
mgnify:CR=1 FL=1